MKYIFLVNSFSLKDKTNDMIFKIDKVCKKRKLNYKIEVNSINLSTEDILDKYQNEEDIIITIGGDGIINRALNKIVNTKNILGFIPYGTGNDFNRKVKEEIKEEITDIDIIKINNKYFLNVACFGIDADIANNSNIIHNKLIPKKQRYNISLLYNFFKYKPRELKIKVNDNIYHDLYTTVILCNASFYGGGYKVGTYSSILDGKLELYMYSKMNKIKMMNLILGMKKAKHELSNKLTKIECTKLNIESKKEITCNIDGEELKDKKFNIELLPKKIKLYYNKDLINEILK